MHWQVNDTHVHKPLKSHHRNLAHEWFMRNVVRLRLRHRLYLREQDSASAEVPSVASAPVPDPAAVPPAPAQSVPAAPSVDPAPPSPDVPEAAQVQPAAPAVAAAAPAVAVAVAVSHPPPGSGLRPLPTEDYKLQMRALMSMTRLRNLGPVWLLEACNQLLLPIEGEGRNIFRKGWDQLYLDPINEPGAVCLLLV